jgi:hypothetical protein
MTKVNLTVQLDSDVVRRARVLAAKRGTSVSALVARELDALVDRDERYESARDRAVQLLGAAKDRGGRRWSREDLYAERTDRRAR